MGTHDEDTRKYFAGTKVNCILFPREGTHTQDSLVGRNTTDRIFTHHQKTVRFETSRGCVVSSPGTRTRVAYRNLRPHSCRLTASEVPVASCRDQGFA